FRLLSVHGSAAEMIDAVGLAERRSNVGAVAGLGDLSALIRPAVLAAQAELDQLFDAAATAAQEKVARWSERIASWDREAADLAQRLELRQRRLSVEQEKELVEKMAPARRLVRPVLVVVPADHPAEVA